MAILENRVKISNKYNNFFKLLQIVLKRSLIVFFIILSIGLLYFSKPKRLENLSLEIVGNSLSIGLAFYEKVFSSITVLSEKLAYLNDMKAENLRLKLQVANFSSIENTVEALKSENLALRNLLNVVPDENYEHITARLLSISLNPFSKTMLIAAGVKNGVEVNQIVTNEKGLIGRIIQTSDNYSRVMLVNDFNSRVPVVTLLTHERGILTGDNSIVQMIYLQKNNKVKEGEKVITSGDGVMYPRGITVGEISKNAQGQIIVEPINFSETDFVNIFKPSFTSKEIEKNN